MPPKAMWKKRALSSILSTLSTHPHPRARLEQYTIDSETAADVLRLAAYTYGDILGKVVFDLGCGTGRLGIGAYLLGAGAVVGVDIDGDAIATATSNGNAVDAEVSWIIGDIDCLKGVCDTVVQNPPFGVQRRQADRRFLQKSLEVAKVVYSLHKGGAKNRAFIEKFVEDLGGEITTVLSLKMPIPATLPFHRKRKHIVDVDLFRLSRCGNARDQYAEIGRWIAKNYSKARKIVEVGVGALPSVAISVKEMLPNVEVVVTDVNRERLAEIRKTHPQLRTQFDDILTPNLGVYKGASLIYSIRPHPELVPYMIRVARAVAADLLLRPLSIGEAGFEFTELKYVGSLRAFFLSATT